MSDFDEKYCNCQNENAVPDSRTLACIIRDGFCCLIDAVMSITGTGGPAGNIETLLEQIRDKTQFDVKNTPAECINGTWQYHCVKFENGVEVDRQTIDTGSPCDQPAPTIQDVEKVEVCVNGTIHIQSYIFAIDPQDPLNATKTIIDDTDTGVPCGDLQDVTEICKVTKCDRLADGTKQTYTEAALTIVRNGVLISSNTLGIFTDDTLSAPYTPVEPIDCCELDPNFEEALLAQNVKFLEDGASWQVTAQTQSYAVVVITANGGSFTDSSGNTVPLISGQKFDFCSSDTPLMPGARVDTITGEQVLVYCTEYITQ